MSLTLYHSIPSRSSTAMWMLEEIGAPYDVVVLDQKKGEQRQPAYLAVNPMGKVPALVHDGAVVTECAAICCYLADAFPEACLAPAARDAQRGAYLKWLFFGPSCIEPAALDKALKREPAPRGMAGYGSYEDVLDVLSAGLRGRACLLDRFSAADIVIGATLSWMLRFKLVPERPEYIAYVQGLEARPARQRQIARDATQSAVHPG